MSPRGPPRWIRATRLEYGDRRSNGLFETWANTTSRCVGIEGKRRRGCQFPERASERGEQYPDSGAGAFNVIQHPSVHDPICRRVSAGVPVTRIKRLVQTVNYKASYNPAAASGARGELFARGVGMPPGRMSSADYNCASYNHRQCQRRSGRRRRRIKHRSADMRRLASSINVLPSPITIIRRYRGVGDAPNSFLKRDTDWNNHVDSNVNYNVNYNGNYNRDGVTGHESNGRRDDTNCDAAKIRNSLDENGKKLGNRGAQEPIT